jgi:hypothetical protein
MKATRCTTAFAVRLLAMLSPVVLLVQCSMPPQQAWSYIKSNGLLPYLNQRPSPPFRTGGTYAQRYTYPQRRPSPVASWFSNWSSGMPSNIRYSNTGSSSYASNSYITPRRSGSSSARNVPRSKPSRQSEDRSSGVKIPLDEPSPAPRIANNPAPTNTAPQTNNTPATSSAADNLPYGTPVPGRINMVNSPHAGKTQLVDVSGMSAGQTVKCPYTGKMFKVPPTQQAANRVEPRLESKADASKSGSESKAGDKKP